MIAKGQFLDMLDNIRENLRAVPKSYPGIERALQDADTICAAYLADELVLVVEDADGWSPDDHMDMPY